MSRDVTVEVVNVGSNPLPGYETLGSSGIDLRSDEDCAIKPGKLKMVKTGLHVAIPEGFEIQIRPRSGLAYKKQITVLNSPGTIDSDYRGPVNILLFNSGEENFVVTKGDRIAQAVLCPVYNIIWKKLDKVEELSETIRGEGGFGHTGV